MKLALFTLLAAAQTFHLATGVKIGEVTANSALVWVRTTADSTRGEALRARISYGTSPDLGQMKFTEWTETEARNDYAYTFTLRNLQPNTRYHFRAETTSRDDSEFHRPLWGTFVTAPERNHAAPVTFAVCSGKDPDLALIRRLAPAFIVVTGEASSPLFAELAQYWTAGRAPVSLSPTRTFRWGRHLQIWLSGDPQSSDATWQVVFDRGKPRRGNVVSLNAHPPEGGLLAVTAAETEISFRSYDAQGRIVNEYREAAGGSIRK